jgi:anthranilate phosphoribosyltransferase
LRGGDKVHNAAIVRDVLAGRGGRVTEAVMLNAAAGIAAYDAASTAEGLASRSLHDALAVGLQQAADSVESGAAAELLESWIKASQHAKQ